MKMESNTARKTFVLRISFVILLFILGIFIGVFIQNRKLIEAAMSNSARAYVTLIILGIVTFLALIGMIYFLIRQLIKKLEKAEQKIRDMANKDALTDLYNRSYFLEQLDLESRRAIRFNLGLSVIMLDVDHFKTINDA